MLSRTASSRVAYTWLYRWEETVVMAEFQANFTDAELQTIETDFIKQMDPKHLQELTPMFMRAGNIDDRTRMLFAIKVPPPYRFFTWVSDLLLRCRRLRRRSKACFTVSLQPLSLGPSLMRSRSALPLLRLNLKRKVHSPSVFSALHFGLDELLNVILRVI